MINGKKFLLVSIIVVTILIFFLCMVSIVKEGLNTLTLRRKQQALAGELGVKIDFYNSPAVFPVGYYATVLKPNMTFAEVHQLVRGYQQVLLCDGSTEIYYNFSTEDKSAIRFGIEYDDQGRYKQLEAEKPGSGLLIISKEALASGTCSYGLFGK
jgi:hypothetical protein